MKNNLISGIASWKSAALLAIVAVVAAVAFSGVLTNTQTAEAANVPLPATGNSAPAAPGDTVQITVAGELAQVSITGTGDGVSASFAANDGQSINCSDGLACDKSATDDEIQVDLNIDADSSEGFILLSVSGAGLASGNTPLTTKVITVSKAKLLGSLTAGTSSKTIAANDDDTSAGDGGPNEATILATVKNAAATPAGLDFQRVTFITTLGTLACPASTAPAGGTDIAAVSGVQVCSVFTSTQDNPLTTESDSGLGFASVRLDGAGREGVATVTVTVGGFTEQLDVVMYGTAKNLKAEPQQGSIEIGGSVFVVLTVTDDAGNPVSGQPVTAVTSPAVEVTGPEGVEKPVLVVTEKDTDAVSGESDAGVGYSKDLIVPNNAAANIPACGDDNTGSQASPSEEVFTDNGTNDNGQCVVYVTAPEKADGAAADATRGAHTLNFAIGAIKASATIEVAGKPDSISTDAPDTVDPGSVTEITVSVWDDEEILVGITSVKVRKVDGGGLIEDEGDGGSEMTSNGQSKFTFIAPSNPGASEILITAGAINHRVAINIGEAPADDSGWNKPLASGTHNLVWNGADGADPADAGDVVAIWQWTGSGWVGYFSAAGDVGLANTLTELSNGEAYWVVVE